MHGYAITLITLFKTVLLTTVMPAFAGDEYPVKLKFEQISKQTVSALLHHSDTPEIIIYSWQKALKAFQSKPPTGRIAEYDLNGDGTKEVFLYLTGSGLCGRGGCHLIIFQYSGETAVLEYKTARSGSDDIWILSDLTEGHHNIAIRSMDGTTLTKAKKYTVYDWQNGNLRPTDRTLSFQPLEDHCDEYVPGLF